MATLSSYGRRAVVVGGVADRYASELARAGQSNRRRAGTGSASSECATRPPLWPAGMAEGNRETFGPRLGLSSHGSPAKGGPKSKCLARLKIARTSAGPPSSDPSRFPNSGPVPLSQFQPCCNALLHFSGCAWGSPVFCIVRRNKLRFIAGHKTVVSRVRGGRTSAQARVGPTRRRVFGRYLWPPSSSDQP